MWEYPCQRNLLPQIHVMVSIFSYCIFTNSVDEDVFVLYHIHLASLDLPLRNNAMNKLKSCDR